MVTALDFVAPDRPFVVGVQCTNMPLGGVVILTVTALPNEGFRLPDHKVPPTRVVVRNLFIGIRIDDWPPGSKGKAVCDYQPGTEPMLRDSKLTIELI